jgi:hypothetical protein
MYSAHPQMLRLAAFQKNCTSGGAVAKRSERFFLHFGLPGKHAVSCEPCGGSNRFEHSAFGPTIATLSPFERPQKPDYLILLPDLIRFSGSLVPTVKSR